MRSRAEAPQGSLVDDVPQKLKQCCTDIVYKCWLQTRSKFEKNRTIYPWFLTSLFHGGAVTFWGDYVAPKTMPSAGTDRDSIHFCWFHSFSTRPTRTRQNCLVLSVSAVWTELATRQDSFVLSRPSFQFTTVQSQIYWWLLKTWKLETGSRRTKQSCLVSVGGVIKLSETNTIYVFHSRTTLYKTFSSVDVTVWRTVMERGFLYRIRCRTQTLKNPLGPEMKAYKLLGFEGRCECRWLAKIAYDSTPCPKKLCKIVFVRTSSNFRQFW